MEENEEFDERTCTGCINKELRLVSVLPTHEKTELLVDSQWSWGRISVTYVVYRLTVGILMIVWALADFFDETGRNYSFNWGIWFVFVTNWSLLFLCICCVVMATTTTYYYVLSRSHGSSERDLRAKPIGVGLMAQWVIYNIAANASIVVTISYWTYVIVIDGSELVSTPMSQMKHTLNTVYVIVDMFINAVPVRILHLVYPLAVGLIYVIFNALYFINDGVGVDGRRYAYYVLDWSNPLGSIMACFFAFMLSACVQGLLYAIYRSRLWFHRKLTSRIGDDLEQAVLGKVGDAEDASIFPNNLSTPNYNSVDVELRTG